MMMAAVASMTAVSFARVQVPENQGGGQSNEIVLSVQPAGTQTGSAARNWRSAQGTEEIVTVEYALGSSAFSSSFRDNASALQDFEALVRQLNDGGGIVTGVIFCGGASPEGGLQTNISLAKARRESFERYVRARIHIDDSKVRREDMFFPWDKLRREVEASDIQGKEEVVRILAKTQGKDAASDEETIESLKHLDGGVWEQLEERFFASMRNAFAVFTTIFSEVPEIEVGEVECPDMDGWDILTVADEPVRVSPMTLPEKPLKPISLLAKTNTLLLATLNANLGLEVGMGGRFSIEATGTYSPWNLFAQDRKIRLFGIQPEIRYWWGEPTVKGHFIGLHAHVYGFNVQFNDKYRYQDPNHAAWGVGLSYGYAMPFKQGSPWGVQFVIGGGYADISYDQYDGCEDGLLLKSGKTDWWGITRLGVDITYRFDIQRNRRDAR